VNLDLSAEERYQAKLAIGLFAAEVAAS